MHSSDISWLKGGRTLTPVLPLNIFPSDQSEVHVVSLPVTHDHLTQIISKFKAHHVTFLHFQSHEDQ
jgi:coproporphyrinogen III oxidase